MYTLETETLSSGIINSVATAMTKANDQHVSGSSSCSTGKTRKYGGGEVPYYTYGPDGTYSFTTDGATVFST